MNLILNASLLPTEMIHSLIEHIVREFPGTCHLSLCTLPGRPANVAYDSVQRLIPGCRALSAWSQSEMLAGACAGWRDPLCCWWPVTERDTWPTWTMIDRLQVGMSHVYDMTGVHSPVGFAGWRDGEGVVEPQRCSYEACDVLAGPLMFAQPWGSAVVSERNRMPGVNNAGHILCIAAAWRRRACCYVVPEGVSPAVNVDCKSIERTVARAAEMGWRSRVAV